MHLAMYISTGPFDCPMGYHQVLINKRVWPRLAFAGHSASLFTYGVMLFDPVNSLVIFINMIFNINGEWQVMAIDNGFMIDDDTNTNIIVDNFFNWAISEDQSILYIEAQFTVAALCRLSFSLPKSLFFPDCVEFIGINIAIKFNIPAVSKFELPRKWPKAVVV